ncbi:MAG TPA: bifunctional hydroxymethylpyrimidine kinase/phosphomethylpyrimidine kinase, partial [Methanocorpusculum sp.]|nr:bifunctional hydroxymethylpyrimidine kinase/phosphomethylpyrimidine kinase [Methanocorpusculum sp.]
MKEMAFAVSVAGSDSSAGAGLQVDLKTMTACGVWGMTVVAALTAQNGHAVTAVEGVPPYFIGKQVEALEAEYPIGCYKTGMLMNAEIVSAAAS